MSKWWGARKGRLAMIPALLLVSIATPQTYALDKVSAGVSFTLQCAGLMLTDPAKHVAVCNPVMPPQSLDSLVKSNDSVVVPTKDPDPEPEPEPCDYELLGGLDAVDVAAVQLAEVDECYYAT